ncbi:Uncharacterised protein [Vibrio cholerae]|nr:Uncharacterised protein [Vibrio cholerae]
MRQWRLIDRALPLRCHHRCHQSQQSSPTCLTLELHAVHPMPFHRFARKPLEHQGSLPVGFPLRSNL